MQTKKMSLANIHGKLSRVEMKQIMAGSAGCGLTCPSGIALYVNYNQSSYCVTYSSGILCGSGSWHPCP